MNLQLSDTRAIILAVVAAEVVAFILEAVFL